MAPVALVILFLPELRQAIEGFARVGLWSGKWIGREGTLATSTIDELVKATAEMSQANTGALLVIERNNKLDDISGNGVPVRALVTAPLLGAIFYEGNPLHDGAVIIREGEVLAAACRLPLSESSRIGDKYHMRHRAGIGISEQSDAVVLIVSEERGSISLAIDGHLEMVPNAEKLHSRLTEELSPESGSSKRSPEIVRRAKSIKEASSKK
ncbi:DNA integrity scanning protein DisA nucleotide-binding domain protein [Kamptonema cortianum]|nr:DNA integrity scanning protein DisA nucleotide-binding domain protein [Kamptonema cortianum]